MTAPSFLCGQIPTSEIEEGFKSPKLLSTLLALPHETEWLDFKEAKISYNPDKLGQYFPALSNEARLKNRQCRWLIFRVRDDHTVCGTSYRGFVQRLPSAQE